MILYDPICLLGAPLFSVFAWKTLLLVVALKKKGRRLQKPFLLQMIKNSQLETKPTNLL